MNPCQKNNLINSQGTILKHEEYYWKHLADLPFQSPSRKASLISSKFLESPAQQKVAKLCWKAPKFSKNTRFTYSLTFWKKEPFAYWISLISSSFIAY